MDNPFDDDKFPDNLLRHSGKIFLVLTLIGAGMLAFGIWAVLQLLQILSVAT